MKEDFIKSTKYKKNICEFAALEFEKHPMTTGSSFIRDNRGGESVNTSLLNKSKNHETGVSPKGKNKPNPIRSKLKLL